MSNKSVFKKEFSVGDHYGKPVCEEDATGELKVYLNCEYVKTSRMGYQSERHLKCPNAVQYVHQRSSY
jgi:hypothetical protein